VASAASTASSVQYIPSQLIEARDHSISSKLVNQDHLCTLDHQLSSFGVWIAIDVEQLFQGSQGRSSGLWVRQEKR
jgi:hypothetical protein